MYAGVPSACPWIVRASPTASRAFSTVTNESGDVGSVVNGAVTRVVPPLINAVNAASWVTMVFIVTRTSSVASRRSGAIRSRTRVLAAIESLDAGVTTTVDWSHGLQSVEHAEAAVDAVVPRAVDLRCDDRLFLRLRVGGLVALFEVRFALHELARGVGAHRLRDDFLVLGQLGPVAVGTAAGGINHPPHAR